MKNCTFNGCDEKVLARGLCRVHYRADQAGDRTCSQDGCDRVEAANGVCLMHYKRKRRHGSYDAKPRNLGPSELLEGYVRVYHDRYIRLIKYDGTKSPVRVMEHRVAMEQHLGRPLLAHENVHHINGDRSNNSIENLELWSSSQPSGQRVEDKLAWAREIIATYGFDLQSLTVL